MAIIFLLTPGILIIYVFLREVFLSLDTLKLLLLSMAITAPLSIINFFWKPDALMKELGDFKSLVLSIFQTGLILYVGTMLSWFIGLSLNMFIVWTLVIAAIILGKEEITYKRRARNGISSVVDTKQ